MLSTRAQNRTAGNSSPAFALELCSRELESLLDLLGFHFLNLINTQYVSSRTRGAVAVVLHPREKASARELVPW